MCQYRKRLTSEQNKNAEQYHRMSGSHKVGIDAIVTEEGKDTDPYPWLASDDPCHWRIQDFPWGALTSYEGCQLLRWLHVEKFVCQNERIWTLRGAHAGGTPLDLPMHADFRQISTFFMRK